MTTPPTGSAPEPATTEDPNAVVIEVRPNGPFRVRGPFRLVDHEGHDISLPVGKPSISLCRCGASSRKPFCDSTHKRMGLPDPPPVADAR